MTPRASFHSHPRQAPHICQTNLYAMVDDEGARRAEATSVDVILRPETLASPLSEAQR
jgi:hypothetical protein